MQNEDLLLDSQVLYWRRKRLKLSVDNAAALIGISTSLLLQIEAGAVEPSEGILQSIATVYDFDYEELRRDFLVAAQIKKDSL
jgi:transcriptional regulator with XRE-family HTH domain